MRELQQRQRAGLEYLDAITALLRRGRRLHPTKGLYEAGELQWWWGRPRPTDELGQLFWFDEQGQPEAGVIITEWSDRRVTLDPIVMPDADADWIAQVIEEGLAHAAAAGFANVELEVDRTDATTIEILTGRGFALKEEGLAESWLTAEARPEVSPIKDGYRLTTRANSAAGPHHMVERMGPDVEQRLLQTSLYRPDLDLFVLDADDTHAATGMFWYDPELAIGVVEPMRTEDAHQKRGLARHILTSGIDLLAKAGAERIKICFDPGNEPARNLYLSVGFEPVKQTDGYAGPTGSASP